MKIVRVALEDEFLKSLEEIVQKEGFISLSEFVRYCIRETLKTFQEKNKKEVKT